MPTKTKRQPRIDKFHITQQLGFKPVLHCWCGDSFDFNVRYKSRKTAKAWMSEHEACEMPKEVSHE